MGAWVVVRILIFSDLHLHNHVYGATLIEGVNSRLLDGAAVLDQIAEYVYVNPVDEIVFCGDLFHTHGKLDATVLKVAFEGFDNIRLLHGKPYHITALVGNHDTADKTMQTHAMHWLDALGVNVVDGAWHNGAKTSGLPADLSFLAYTESVDEIQQFLNDAAAKGGNPVCFLHAGVDGVPMKSGFVPGSAFNTGMIPAGIQHVFSGHYHPHMRVTDKATVVGTPLQLNWADEGDTRGFLIYDTDTGVIEQIPIYAPKFVTYNMTNALRLGRQVQDEVEGNFVRVINYDPAFQEDIRREFSEAGARSVEFVVKVEAVERMQPLSSDDLQLSEIIKEYEEQKNVTPERSKVGEELRK